MFFADQYPDESMAVDEKVFGIIREKGLRAYIEYPSWLPDLEVHERINDSHKRAVVNTGRIGPQADSLGILVINGMEYCRVESENPLISAARVAGFDEAVYGLPEEYDPLLFKLPGYDILISTTCLSRPVKGRYAPRESWESVWEFILHYILPESERALNGT